MSGYAGGYAITDSAGGPGGGGAAISAGASSQSTGTVIFSNSNGVSFGLNAGTLTASVVPGGGAALTVSDNATSLTVSRLAFTQSNGITMSLSTGAGAATVIGSYTVPTVTNSSWTVSDAVTSGTVGRLAFTNLNGVTLSLSTGAAGSHTIVGSHNALTSQSNQAFSADASSTFQTLTFQNSNGVSFSNNAGALRVTHDLQFTSNTSNITSNAMHSTSRPAFSADASSTFQTLTFQNSNGISFSNNVGAIRVTHDLQYTSNTSAITSNALHSSKSVLSIFAGSNTTVSTSGTAASNSFVLSGAGIASVEATNGGFVISVPAGGGAGDGYNIIGVSTGGNTAGDTGTTNSVTMVLQGSNSMTLSQQTGVAGVHTIHLQPPLSVLTAGGGISLSSNGSTITVSNLIGLGVSNTGNTAGNTRTTQQTIVFAGSNEITVSQSTGAANDTIWIMGDGGHQSYHVEPAFFHNTATMSFGQSTSYFYPFVISKNLSIDRMRVLVSGTVQASSTQATTGNTSLSMSAVTSHNIVIYKRDTGANSMSLTNVTSTQHVAQELMTISYNANSTQYSVSLRFTLGSDSFTKDYSSSVNSINWHTSHLTDLTGNRYLDVPFGVSLSPGQYWIGYGRSTTQATQNGSVSEATRMIVNENSMMGMSQNTLALGMLGSNTNSSVGWRPGHGSFTTNGAAGTTNNFHISKVSTTASNGILFVQLMRIA